MKQFWIDSCMALGEKPAEFYSGARKIIRRVRLEYKAPRLTTHHGMKPLCEDTLVMADCGFTKSKTSMLMRNYYVSESIAAAQELWKLRVSKGKYGSVGFSCYGHYIKGGKIDQDKSNRLSVMGPCLQSVTLTLTKRGHTSVDVFYRTTELFKKFPADLVFLRDNLLAQFDFKKSPIEDIAFHFANVTIHPAYLGTLLPHLDEPVEWFERLRKRDKFFWQWGIKWTARYVCSEHSRGIQKHAQSLRVKQDVVGRLSKEQLKDLQKYFRKNHPGHKNDYSGVIDEEMEG